MTSKETKLFRDFMEEQLDSIAELRFKPMFGGFGLYSVDIFFGIISGERLYLRTSEQTATRYEKAGMSYFVSKTGRTLKRYYEVPLSVLERKKELCVWANEAIACGKAV